MRSTKLALAAVAALSLTPTISFAEGAPMPAAPLPVEDAMTESWYVGGFGGFGFTKDRRTTFNEVEGPFVIDLDFGTGWQAGAQIGYKSGPVRFEGQYVYLSSDDDATAVVASPLAVAAPTSNEVEVHAGMFNVIYDLDNLFQDLFNTDMSAFTIVPYLGAGIGYAHVKAEATGVVAGATRTVTDSSNEFAYQGIAGMYIPFSEQFNFFVDYRYFGATEPSFFNKSYENHTVNFGINVLFDGGELFA